MSAVLHAYHRLPAPLRSVAATLRGAGLHAWKYGPETDRLADEALSRERWSKEQWRGWQAQALQRILQCAVDDVSFYREEGRHGALTSLESWPILEKDSVRRSPRAFVSQTRYHGRACRLCTSGTTGKPIELWHAREAMHAWYALAEARWRRWYGVSRHARWANVGGQLVVPVSQRQPPFWVWNQALHQLYMSSYHLAPDLLPFYLDALAKWRIDYLWGYSSSLYALARGAIRMARTDLRMRVAIANAEPLYPHQREAIAKAFQCPAVETYGMTEMTAGASECEAGSLHAWPEAGVLEVVTDDGVIRPFGRGELLCTGLLNPIMPLIRYRVGDRVELAPPDMICACGRTLPVIRSVEGRTDDVLYTRDGRRVGRLDPVFKHALPIREAQIVQEALDRVVIRVAADIGYQSSHGELLAARLRERMGPVEVDVHVMKEIPRGPNGKFRAVICAIPREERALLMERDCAQASFRLQHDRHDARNTT